MLGTKDGVGIREEDDSIEEDENDAREEVGDGGGKEDDGVEEDGNGTGKKDGDGNGEEFDGIEEDMDNGHGPVDIRRRGLLNVRRRFRRRHKEREKFSKCQRA